VAISNNDPGYWQDLWQDLRNAAEHELWEHAAGLSSGDKTTLIAAIATIKAAVAAIEP